MLWISGNITTFTGVRHICDVLIADSSTLYAAGFVFIHITYGIAHVRFTFVGYTAILTYISHGRSPDNIS